MGVGITDLTKTQAALTHGDIHGAFRTACERVLGVLRSRHNRESIIALLEVCMQ